MDRKSFSIHLEPKAWFGPSVRGGQNWFDKTLVPNYTSIPNPPPPYYLGAAGWSSKTRGVKRTDQFYFGSGRRPGTKPVGFTAADTRSGAYSSAQNAFSSFTAARRFVIFLDMIDFSTNSQTILGTNSVNTELSRFTSNNNYRINWTGSSICLVNTTVVIEPGHRHKQLITIDFTAQGTDTTGTVNDVVKWWTYDVVTDTFVAQPLAGTIASTLGGTRTVNLSSTLAGLYLGSRNGTNGALCKFNVLGMLVGDETLALPAPANKKAFLDLFSDANVRNTLLNWTNAWWCNVDRSVGNSDGSSIDTWNATGGLQNRIAGKPALIKQAGTYS